MKGILTWAYDLSWTIAAKSYSAAAATVSFIYHVPENFNDYIKETTAGATAVLDKDTVNFLIDNKSQATREGLMQSLTINLGYAGLSALYAGPVKNLMRYLPYMENPFVEFSVDMLASAGIYGLWMLANGRYKNASEEDQKHPYINYSLDLLPSMVPAQKLPVFVPTRLKLNMLASDLLLNRYLTAAVAQDNEKVLEIDPNLKNKAYINSKCSQPYNQCNCLIPKKIKANFVSIAYYMAEQGAIYMLKRALPYGEYMTLPLQALSFGKFLMEYKLSSVGNGMCTRHRREILNQNNLYALGFGGSLLLLSEVVTRVVMSRLGIDPNSAFKDEIKSGVTNFLGHWFIMQAILQDRKFPGTKDGIEVFYLTRYLMKEIMKRSVGVATSVLNKINSMFPSNEPCDLREELNKIVESKAFKIAAKITLTKDMQNLESFLRTQPVRLFSDMYVERIRKLITLVRSTSKFPGSSIIPAITERTPAWVLASKGARYALCFFFGKELEIALFDLEKDIEFVRSVQLDEFAKITHISDPAAMLKPIENYREPPAEKEGVKIMDSVALANPQKEYGEPVSQASVVSPQFAQASGIILDQNTTITYDEDDIIGKLMEDPELNPVPENKSTEDSSEEIDPYKIAEENEIDAILREEENSKKNISEEFGPVKLAGGNSPLRQRSLFSPKINRLHHAQDADFAPQPRKA